MQLIHGVRDHVFHRDFHHSYPIITYGKGIYLFEENGKRYLDASSGAAAANLGHGLEEIADAMAQQARKAAFVHTLRFETEVLHRLAEEIAALVPGSLNRVYLTSGGSEANESAIKLAQQYHRDRGNKDKHIAIGRWQSYHGNTLGSLSVGGDVKRRQPYTSILADFPHVHSPYCHRCPLGKTEDSCRRENRLACVDELERLILEIGAEFVSCFICEPIVGSQQGAVVPPEDYLAHVRELCNRYDIVLIIDEVMTGFGRTGKNFAVEHFGVEPDILTFGKGASAGYAPLAGMAVSDKLVDSLIQYGKGRFVHGYTYSGHPVSAAAGLAAIRYYRDNGVLKNAVSQGEYIRQRLEEVREKHHTIGQIRGKGLLLGLELLADRHRDVPFAPAFPAADRLNEAAMELGAVFYPGKGTIDGTHGDHLLICPPLTIRRNEADELIDILDRALTVFENRLQQEADFTGEERGTT